jgi:hypothetical protein
MEKYITDDQLADQTFLGLQPPEVIASMKGARPMRVNRRMRKHVSEKKYEAKVSFLDRIHQEIYEAKPEWQKQAIQRELESLAKGEDEEGNLPPETLEKPELTADYLRSIGREDLIEWGTGRDE